MHRRCVHASLGFAKPLRGSYKGTCQLKFRAASTAATPPSVTTSDASAQLPSPRKAGKTKIKMKKSHKVLDPKVSKAPPPQTLKERQVAELSNIIRDGDPRPGEWQATPASGLDTDITSMKLALKRHEARLNVDNVHSVMATNDGATLDDDYEIEMAFKPGTLVETRKNNQAFLAIVIDEVISDRVWRVHSLASSGEIFAHSRADVHFAVPNFISADHATRCGTDYITQDDRELTARVEALKKLRQGMWDLESAHKGSDNWQRQRAVNIYDETRSPDPKEWGKTTVKHVAQLLWQMPGFINYFGAHKYLIEDPLHYVASSNYLKAQTFHVRPQQDVEEIQQVRRWVNDYRNGVDGPMKWFVDKAKKAVEAYREKRKREGLQEGPISQAPAQHVWEETDQVFIQFLLKALAPVRSNQNDPFEIGRNALLQLLAPPNYVVTEELLSQVLTELGAIAPWQSPWELTRWLNPRSDFTTTQPLIKAEEKIFERSIQNKAVAGAVLGPEDFHPTDPLDSVRHDFGNMDVYVIDDANAHELDDGLSVEEIPSEPGKYWVHIHIADPAAIIHPRHKLALHARDRGATYYLNTATLPLLPKSLVHHPLLGTSLGQRGPERGTLTLSFSLKVDLEGNIFSHQLRAGIVRNVRVMTYDQCDDVLGLPRFQRAYPFGRSSPSAPTQYDPVPEVQATHIKLLYQIGLGQIKKRYNAGLYMPFNHYPETTLVTSPAGDIQSPSLAGSKYQGFPQLEYSVNDTSLLDTGSHSMVAEMMKLACRVASRVALENDVQVIRRAMDPATPRDGAALREVLEARTWHGYIPLHKYQNHFFSNPASYNTLQAKGHLGIGVQDGEGYSRTTSPLRRFEDMVTHWNLHHILLGSKAPARPPFSPTEMEELCVEVTTLERDMRTVDRGDSVFWSLLFIKRYMEARKAGKLDVDDDILSRPLRAYKYAEVRKNISAPEAHCRVIIPELGMKAEMTKFNHDFSLEPISSEIDVRIEEATLGLSRAILRVVPWSR